MARLFLQWFLSAGALLLVANLFSGVQVHSLSSALWAALILGLLNAVLRPVLVVLTLPVTLVTLGLFLLVVNGLVFWLASGLLGGLQASGFWAAVWGALLYSACGLVIDSLLARFFPQ
jgi:putative membrane protein